MTTMTTRVLMKKDKASLIKMLFASDKVNDSLISERAEMEDLHIKVVHELKDNENKLTRRISELQKESKNNFSDVKVLQETSDKTKLTVATIIKLNHPDYVPTMAQPVGYHMTELPPVQVESEHLRGLLLIQDRLNNFN